MTAKITLFNALVAINKPLTKLANAIHGHFNGSVVKAYTDQVYFKKNSENLLWTPYARGHSFQFERSVKNGEINVPTKDGNVPFVCRHFAAADLWVRNNETKSLNTRESRAAYLSIDRGQELIANFEQLDFATHLTFNYSAHNHRFLDHDFGVYLRDAFSKLDLGEKRSFFMATQRHAMTLTLKRKSEHAYSFTIYDPNIPDAQLKMRFEHPDEAADVQFTDFYRAQYIEGIQKKGVLQGLMQKLMGSENSLFSKHTKTIDLYELVTKGPFPKTRTLRIYNKEAITERQVTHEQWFKNYGDHYTQAMMLD